jgi:hypothetical protein
MKCNTFSNKSKTKVVNTGFKLNESHVPRNTTLQRYIRTKYLYNIYDAVESIITSVNVATLQLTAFNIKYIVSVGSECLAVIGISPTKDLLNFQS